MHRSSIIFLALAGCTHTYFQFTPNTSERASLQEMETALLTAGAAKDPASASKWVDPEGRKAALLAAHDLVEEKDGEAAKTLDAFVGATLILAALDAHKEPLEKDTVEKTAPWLKEQVEKAVAARVFGGQVSPRGLVPSIADEFFPKVEARRARLAAKFVDELVPDCSSLGPVVSYRASILDHVEWHWARQSTTFSTWRKDVRAIHLVKLACGERVGLWLVDSYDDGSRLAAFHYFTKEEWALVEPKLKRVAE